MVEADVATIEERISRVEGRIEEQAIAMLNIRDDIRELGQRMEQRFVGVDQRFMSMEQRFNQIDQRFTQIDQRFTQVDQRFTQIDQRFTQVDQRLTRIDQRVSSLDDKISKQLYWIVGIQMTTFAATIAMFTAFLGR
jgi:chromosome segregation ATPase